MDHDQREVVHRDQRPSPSGAERAVDYEHSGSPTLVHPLCSVTAQPHAGVWTEIADVPRERLFTGFIGRIG